VHKDLILTARMVTATIGLRAGNASVYLELAVPWQDWDKWLGAELQAESFDDARAFVTEIAKWLDVPVQEPRGGHVKTTFNWSICKLTLQNDRGHAEVYLNIHDGGEPREVFGELGVPREIAMTEKDESYRKDLVRLLHGALAQSVD